MSKRINNVDIVKHPSIDKKDIITADGKLNLLGTILIVGVCLTALNYFFENFVTDKENSN